MKTKILFILIITLFAFSGLVTAQDGGRPLYANMTGAAERPGPGDPDGTGTALFWLNQGQGRICYELRVFNIALPATGAHIHFAPPTAPGPIVVHLLRPNPETGFVASCVENVPEELIKAIRQNPGAYYVNVHNALFPAGAIRGQLAKRD